MTDEAAKELMNKQGAYVIEQLTKTFHEALLRVSDEPGELNMQLIPIILINFSAKVLLYHSKFLNLTKDDIADTVKTMCEHLTEICDRNYE